MRTLVVGAAMMLAGAGCTGPLEYVRNGFKVGPNYGKPPAPVAAEWIQAKDPNVKNGQLQDSEWWHVFQDQQLDSLVKTAYAQNLNLRAVATRVLQARGLQGIALGNIFPQTQQATASYGRIGLSTNMANNPAVFDSVLSPAALAALPSSQVPTNWYSDWNTGFNMSWELDFWGRIRRSIESAGANLDASVENYDAALVTLLADVATNYVEFRVAQQRIKAASDNVKIQEGVEALAVERFRIGTGTKLDVDQSRSVLEQTRSTIPAFQISQGQANDTLCVLLGIPPHDLESQLGPAPPLGTYPVPNTPAWVAAGLPADLLRRRPDLRSAERQVAAQNAQIGVAEADFYPTFFITGTIGYDAQSIPELFQSQSFEGSILPNFKWNILNYGRIRNNVRVQDAKTQELIAIYQNKALMAGQEVETALRGFLKSQIQVESLAKSVTAAASATDLGVQQYKAGTIDFNRVFNLETTQVQLQDQLAVAQGNVTLNLINVYRALGGGWELREQEEASKATHTFELPVLAAPIPAGSTSMGPGNAASPPNVLSPVLSAGLAAPRN
jgi:NodT family efflux transporter outer membrane factor (OMF) lipoprotein